MMTSSVKKPLLVIPMLFALGACGGGSVANNQMNLNYASGGTFSGTAGSDYSASEIKATAARECRDGKSIVDFKVSANASGGTDFSGRCA